MTIKPGDYTGRQRQKLTEQNAEEQARAAKQMTMLQQVEVETNELDAFDPETGESLGRVDTLKVDAPEQFALIKVVEQIDNMTFGAGTSYSFEVGKQYTVPMDLATYLDELGYVWGGVTPISGGKKK